MNGNSELTLRAVVLGVILSLAMAAANMYLGLKVGITISANIPCSVIALILFHTSHADPLGGGGQHCSVDRICG